MVPISRFIMKINYDRLLGTEIETTIDEMRKKLFVRYKQIILEAMF